MNTTADAFHLPFLEPQDFDGWSAVGAPSHPLRWPLLNPAGAARLAQLTRSASTALKQRSVREIIAVIDAAAERLLRSGPDLDLLTDHIAASTGYSLPMVRHVLETMAPAWRATALEDLVRADLGGTQALDGFLEHPAGTAAQPRDRLRARAVAPDLSVHILAGNVPGVGVTSMIRALLVKAPVFAKVAAGEPVLAPAFARAVFDVDPGIGQAVAVTYWPGGTTDIEDEVFAAAGLIVHYGGRDAIEDARRRAPAHARFVEHGPRVSFGMVARDALAHERSAHLLARDAARATATFDQQGCVSPHVLFVEDGAVIPPARFAALVAAELAHIEPVLPRGNLSAEEAAAIRNFRTEAEFRALRDGRTQLWEGRDLGYTVIFDPTPAFSGSCLNRTLSVHPVASLFDVIPLVLPFRSVLQSAALAAPDKRMGRLVEVLAAAGVKRVTTFDRLPWPAPGWHHDGRGPLRELVEWTDWEYTVS
jgi:hypothetical protein